MTDEDISPYYAFLHLPFDASLEDLDTRYLELTLEFSSDFALEINTKEEVEEQQSLLDEAYGALLARFVRRGEKTGIVKEPLTMKQVEIGQDRMQIQPLTTLADHWRPPPRQFTLTFDSSSSGSDQDEGEVPAAPGFEVEEMEGDIFEAPDRAVIVHSVNCQAVWGYGIAAQLKHAFPQAYSVYRSHCWRAKKPNDLLGTCLLIPPQKQDFVHKKEGIRENNDPETAFPQETIVFGKRRWIACLFTSVGYGKPNMAANNPGKGSKDSILENTIYALEELRRDLEGFGPSNFDERTSWKTDGDKPGEIWSVKFNSGAFGVPWEETRGILEHEFAGFERPWTVVEKKVRAQDEPEKADNSDDSKPSGSAGRLKLRFSLGEKSKSA